MDLTLDEKLSRKINQLEDNLKKLCTRDMQRVDTELLILNTNFATLSTEHRNLEEKCKKNGAENPSGFEVHRRSELEV